MKKILTAAALLLCVICINAQVTQEWVQTYTGGNLAPWNKGIAPDNSGNVYTAGSYYNGSVTSMLLQKYDAAGNLVWTQNYLPAGSTTARALAMAVDGNGDVIVSGTINNNTNIGFTRKYDPNGQLLWSQSSTISNFSLAIDETNNIYITSWDMFQGGGWPMKTIKYDAAGNLLWTATDNSSISGNAHGKIFYKGGFLYRTGAINMNLNARNQSVIYTIKYNASTGAQVWAKTYYHADKLSQAGWDLVVDAGGNVFVTGAVNNKAGKNENMNWVTLKYNSAGTQQWVIIYDGNGNDNSSNGFHDSPNGMTMDNDGNIIVTGTSYTTTGGFSSQDMTTIKYSPAGSQLWVKTYDGPAHGSDHGMAITSDASSNVYITGYLDATTIKYNSSGTVQWMVNYTGGTMRNLLLDNSGNVYAGGSITGSSLLIKYSQSSPAAFTKMENPLIKDAGINVLKLYPNPATDQIILKNGNDKMLGTVSVYDVSGKMVYQKLIRNSQTVIDVKNFSSGVYYLRSVQSSTAIKFVKQ